MLKPLLDRVVVQEIVPENVSPGGIVLVNPDTQKQSRFAKVLAVGPGKQNEEGVIIPHGIEVGWTVVLARHSGFEVIVGDVELRVVSAGDCLGVVEVEA